MKNHMTLTSKAGAAMVLVGACLLFITPFPIYAATQWGANQYIEYQDGDAPIIIDSPHGGTLKPSNIPNRTQGTVLSGLDTGSLETARLVVTYIEQMTGKRPHLIVNHLYRSKLDANRNKQEAANGNAIAGQAWEDFHSFINTAQNTVNAQYGKGLVIDFHANGLSRKVSQVGILLQKNQIANPSSHANISSLSHLKQIAPMSLENVVHGPFSIGGLLTQRNYLGVPNPNEPVPQDSTYYNGAYNTYTHSSRNGGTIDGVQIENHYTFMGKSSRSAYAQAMAETLVCFVEIQYGIDLNYDPKTKCGYSGALPPAPPPGVTFTPTPSFPPGVPTPTSTPPGAFPTPTPTVPPAQPPTWTPVPTRTPVPTLTPQPSNTPTPTPAPATIPFMGIKLGMLPDSDPRAIFLNVLLSFFDWAK